MICYIDNQKINLDISNLKNYLGSGVEGKVFRYKDQAVKIYYDYVDREKKEKKDCFFTTIKTDRIIPPRKIVRDVDGKYLGYANEVIKKREIFKHSSVDVTKEQVVNNFRLLENDSLAFANNFCLMHDVFYNRRDNGTLYFLDTSSYVIISRENSFYKIDIPLILKDIDENNITDETIKKSIRIQNLDICYTVIWKNIENLLLFNKKKLALLKKRIDSDLNQFDESSRLSNLFADYMTSSDTIRSLVKKM